MQAVQRDRWFVAQGMTRRGPLPFERLIQLLQAEAEPRAPLVWHKGLGSWTRAEDIPQVERRLAPVLARATNEATRVGGQEPNRVVAAAAAIDDGKPGSPLLVYGGLAASLFVLGLVGWLFWPPPQTPPRPFPPDSPLVLVSPDPNPNAGVPAPVPSPGASPHATRSPEPPPAPRPVLKFADREADLPRAHVRRLRAVAAWEGETLGLTVENRTAWRVTELQVRVTRFAGEDFEPDTEPLLFLRRGEELRPEVAGMMDFVAPDRKRPGLNPLDTGLFEAKAGRRPEGFRFEIESARGYAPR
jgi:hypothetical protein